MPFIKKNVSNYISWLVCAAYASLFFDIQVSNIALGFLFVLCLLSIDFAHWKRSLAASLPIQLLIGFFVLHVVALAYSQNMTTGLFVLEKKVTLLIMPLLVFPVINQMQEGERVRLLLRLSIITLSSGICFVAIAALKIAVYNYSLAFHRDYFASIAYVYYSMYFAIGSLVLLNWLTEYFTSRWKFYIIVLVLVYSLCLLVVIGSKTGIIAYIIGLIYFFYVRVQSGKLVLLFIAATVVSLALLLAAYPATLTRFTELSRNLAVLKLDKVEHPEEFTGLNLRLFFWKIGVSQLFEDGKWIAGVGTGDAQDFLDRVYEKHNLDDYGYTHFDAHNQWVMTTLQLGLIGACLLAAVFVSGWSRATRSTSTNFKFFALVTACFTFSESILEANKGIVFFALFFCVLCASPNRESTKGL